MAEDEVEGIFSHDCPLGCVYYTIVNINPDKSGQSNFLAKRFLNEKKLLELYPTVHPLVLEMLRVHCLFTLSNATTHQYCIQNSTCHVHTSHTHWMPMICCNCNVVKMFASLYSYAIPNTNQPATSNTSFSSPASFNAKFIITFGTKFAAI